MGRSVIESTSKYFLIIFDPTADVTHNDRYLSSWRTLALLKRGVGGLLHVSCTESRTNTSIIESSVSRSNLHLLQGKELQFFGHEIRRSQGKEADHAEDLQTGGQIYQALSDNLETCRP